MPSEPRALAVAGESRPLSGSGEGPAVGLRDEPGRLPRRGVVDDRLLMICALASGAGLIHVLAAVEHVQEYALYALFFAVLAPAQVAWSIAVYRTDNRRLLVLGAIGSILIVAMWVFSRTTGLPIGPDPWKPESLGTLDVTADERRSPLT